MAITLPRTGVKWQDDQHRTLFETFDKLEKSLAKKDKAEIETVILFLSDYVEDHFKQEEEVMRAANFSGLSEHLDEHTRFQNMIEKIKINWFSTLDDDLIDFFEEFSDLVDDTKEEIPNELYFFLSIWFTIHIKRLDQTLGKFMIQNKVT
ncbi:MAG: hemerythrin family protein [SAR324 cluster bacterium]|nr:hemerythrin family protein [SAR324 cluster bacterium]